ncbi:MAG: response regulator transcription factor [Pirellulaceae bacterium]|nr:response regulator transcription factor [Pirellulaceae bacterium]
MKILVVEDYAPIRNAVTESLRESGYAVDVAVDGEGGLWAASTGNYDCVVLDWMLPKQSGLQVLARLRELSIAAPVLMLTAKDATEDRITGLDSGADDYLVKPFSLGELQARVRALIRRHYVAKNPKIVVADLELDTVAKQVSRRGRPVELSAREYALLEYLTMRSGEVVSRTDIWTHLYEMSDESTSNVVDVYVGYLRRKLETGGGARLIHTRRGLGYVLEAPSE